MESKTAQLEDLLAPAIEALEGGLRLWGIEFQSGDQRSLLRIYIDAGARAVGIEDCERVSHEVSALLDVHDPIAGNYTLEVSSPGLDRPLFTPAQFAAFVGEQVKLNLAAPQDGRRRASGRLLRVEGDRIVIEVDGSEFAVAHGNLLKARLAPQFGPPAKPRKSGNKLGPGKGKHSSNSGTA